MRRFFVILFVSRILYLVSSVPTAQAQTPWPMLGANPERTSWSPEEVPEQLQLLWAQPIQDYVLQGIQPIVADNKVFISTSRGLATFNTNIQTGNQYVWYFRTELPLGNAPTYSSEGTSEFLYVGGLDRNLYKVNADSGALVWKYTAGAGFVTNPVVINDTVYAGNRDGYFYAINTSGSLVWKFDTADGEAPRAQINQSAAYSAVNNRLFFGAMNGYAYGVNAATGALIWKKQLPTMGFPEYWPVVYEKVTPGKVIFTATPFDRGGTQASYDFPGFVGLGKQQEWLYGQQNPPATDEIAGHLISLANAHQKVDLSQNDILGATKSVINFLETYQDVRSTYILEQSTGSEVFLNLDGDTQLDPAPFLITSPEHQASYPPLVTPNGFIWKRNPIVQGGNFSGSMAMGWEWNSKYVHLGVSEHPGGISPQWEEDEWFGISGGGDYLYWNRAACGNVGGADLSIPNLNWKSPGGRQWRYVFGSSCDELDDISVFQESYKFLAEPGKLKPDSMLQYASDHVTGPVPYGDKLFVMLSNTLMAYSASGTGDDDTATVKASTPIPGSTLQAAPSITVDKLQLSLADEINKIIAAGHLKPGYFFTGLSDSHTSDKYRFQDLFDYWANPADTILILTRALPYLNTTLQSQLKTYLTTEFNAYPPYTYRHVGWTEGSFRQSFDFPGAIDNSSVQKKSGGTPPHNFYAIWKYVQANVDPNLNKASFFTNNIKNNLTTNNPSLTSPDLITYPHLLNSYIAGYIGYIELAKLAGESSSYWQPFQTKLDQLKNLRRDNFVSYPSTDTSTTLAKYYHVFNTIGNFLYMTPELGDYLHDSPTFNPPDNDAGIKSIIDRNLDRALYDTDNSNGPRGPYWMLAHSDTVNGENAVMPYHQTHALFQAKAFILKESPAELSKYIDSPVTPVGDLYYISNLVAVLSAGTNPPPPTSPATPTAPPLPSPTPVPGDANGDKSVDILDYSLVIYQFGSACEPPASCSANFNGDYMVDIFDYSILISNFGNTIPTPTPTLLPTATPALLPSPTPRV